MRLRRRIFVSCLIFLLFSLVGGVSARAVFESELCTIGPDDVVEGNVFVLCGDLVVEGQITGHLMGAARTIHIDGSVEGGVYLIGGGLEVSGNVGKDVHFAGVTLDIDDTAILENGGIIATSFSSTVAENTIINGSIIAAGYQLIMEGDVTEEINFWGSTLNIGGDVGGDVTAAVGDSQADGVSSQISTLLIPLEFLGFEIMLDDPGLRIAEDASISGNVSYSAPGPGIIAGQLESAPNFNSTAPAQLAEIGSDPQRGLSLYLGRVLREFVTLALIGLVGLLFMPQTLQSTLRPIQVHPLSTVGVGMLSFIMSFPIILIIFLFSILIVVLLNFLPLDELVLFGGVTLFLVNIGGAGLFYFTAIFIARVIVGYAFGRLLLRLARRDDGTFRSQVISMGLGLGLLSLFGALPVLGWIMYALALFFGLGAILLVLNERWQEFRASDAPPPDPGRYTAEVLAVTPVISYFPEGEEGFESPFFDPVHIPEQHGMQDLPPGFDMNWLNDKD